MMGSNDFSQNISFWMISYIPLPRGFIRYIMITKTTIELKLGYEVTKNTHPEYTASVLDPNCLFKTHWGRDKMATFLTTIWTAFCWMKKYGLRSKFHCRLFLWIQLTVLPHCFRQWLGAEWATSHYLNQCRPDSLTHISDTRRRWVKMYALQLNDMELHNLSHHLPLAW